ncbi:MAG: type II toxin-antitoxin system VapB family antitoxin [Candidatus Marinimicrobia bacterium]|nr:type II toxin-antitoxin system VapB family antitoxin [Candidatus Neomarinimicrobiota bacterium]
MMRTTLTIDDTVANKLLEVTKKDSVIKAVREAIENYIKMKEKEKLLSLFGNIDLDIDLDELRKTEFREVDFK